MSPQTLTPSKKKPLTLLYVAGAILLLIGALVWWTKVSTNPQRVFWGTINQSLATKSVTVEAKQDSQGESLDQLVQYSLGPNSISHTLSKLNQNGTTVVDELVGTTTADYTRYVSVQTDQKNKAGKPLDFSRVTGVWAKSDPKTSGKAQLLSQSVLGTSLPIGGVAVPIGNLSESNRAKLIQEIKNDAVYQVDYKHVAKKTVNGRQQYTYTVTVQPVAYAALMQRFAQLSGLHDLDSLDPSQFKGQAALKMSMTIDVRARHVVTASTNFGQNTQTYSSYDVPASITVPKQTISVAELQKRLNQLQQ
jgi:hypothetical protein